MTTPNFILSLREKIGHDPLWLTGITAYVEDADGRILLGRRSDTGEWALVYGIVEPGEEPGRTCVREVLEETGVHVAPQAIASVKSSNYLVKYANGDQCRYMDILFICSPTDDDAAPFVGDDESTEVGWFPPEELPHPLATSTVSRLAIVSEYKARAAKVNAAALFSL